LLCASYSQGANKVTAAGISHGTCHKVLITWSYSIITQHDVPCVLTHDQYGDRMSTCGDLINRAHKDGTFLNQIITGDETWCFPYNPQLRWQLAAWKSSSWSRKKKQQQCACAHALPEYK
jgi:hypothetical protein